MTCIDIGVDEWPTASSTTTSRSWPTRQRTDRVADEGRDAATLTRFFDELGPQRAADLQAILTDMSAACLKAIAEHDNVDVTVCIDRSTFASGQGDDR